MIFHPQRERLLAEVHARPSTPIDAPMLVTRLAAVSGIKGAEADRLHMADLCARLGQRSPAEGMRWWSVDAGEWQLRWERHSEFSSWTFLRRPTGHDEGTAADLAPRDWVDALPGPLLVFTTVRLRRGHHSHPAPAERQDVIGARLMDGAATLLTDLKTDARGMTRFDVVLHQDDPVLAGRLALILLEIETYRLMALLAFPVAGEAAAQVAEMEAEAAELAARIADDLGVEDDRALLARLVALSGRIEGLSASTNFRFSAGNAYHEIVHDRIASLAEAPIPGLQTIGTFMERRLAPAMRTCQSVAARERALVDRIARAGQMLNTRIELVTQAINADLLASMDRRASAQLKLQRTVEGLSVAAIAYYVVSLLGYVFKGLAGPVPALGAPAALAVAAPLTVAAIWWMSRRITRDLDRH
jgi:uncharacterized membrane-anchored protein